MRSTAVNSGSLEFSRIGFGCCPMGGHGWGDTSSCDFTSAVHAAAANGITLFDTADVYGKGLAETRLGAALGERRGEVCIASKFGVRFDDSGRTCYDSSPQWIRQALEGTLTRLATDWVDLYQLHYWDQVTPLADIAECLGKLQRAGKIRAFGVSNLDLREHPAASAAFQTVSHEYSLAERRNELMIAASIAAGAVFIAWGSLGQGLLSGKYGAHSVFPPGDRRSRVEYPKFHGSGLERSLRVVSAVRQIAADHDATAAQVALAWILHRFPASVALCGIKSAAQACENAAADSLRLSGAALEALHETLS